jgi:hypothetical protein
MEQKKIWIYAKSGTTKEAEGISYQRNNHELSLNKIQKQRHANKEIGKQFKALNNNYQF